MLSIRKRMIVPAMAVAVVTSLSACSDDSAGPETGVSVDDVAEEGAENGALDEEAAAVDPLVGQTVTVSAEVEEIVSPQAFRAGDEELLIVSAGESFDAMGAGFAMDEGLVDDDTVVQVTGTVRQFDLAEFEDEFAVDYDDGVFEPFEGENVIVAQDVSTLAGEPVTISGEVQDVISTVSFRLAGAGWQVVVLDAEQAAVDEGDFVQVEGTVRQLNIAELEDEFGLDLDDELYADYEGDLVLVAENVVDATPVAP